MPAVLARAIMAFINLAREAETRQQDRTRLRAAAEEAALVLLQQLRTGDRAEVGGIVYQAEQVTWSEPTGSTPEGTADHHGTRALLRDNRVLVVAERAERGRGPSGARPKPTGAQQLTRRQPARPGDHATAAVRMATDQDRIAFAHELGAVIEAFGLTLAAEAGQLRSATTDLLALLTD
jgi:hypothetical protein